MFCVFLVPYVSMSPYLEAHMVSSQQSDHETIPSFQCPVNTPVSESHRIEAEEENRLASFELFHIHTSRRADLCNTQYRR